MADFDNVNKWYGFLSKLPIKNLIIVCLLIVVTVLLIWPEKFLYWKSQIQLSFLWLGSKTKRKQIENEINANIMKVTKEVSKEIDDIIPYKIKIEWVTSTDRDAFFDGKNVIVCMDNKKNRMSNIVHAINDYVNNGLLAEEKAYVDDTLFKSSCLVLTRKFLMLSYAKGVSYFLDSILKKESADNDELSIKIDQLITLDENGLFTQVLLRELKEKSKLMVGKRDTSHFAEETIRFVDFLHDISARSSGDDSTKLMFSGNYYKVAILLVANINNYLRFGTSSYIKRFEQNIKEGAKSIYLCARNGNKTIAEKVFKQIKESDKYQVTCNKQFHYSGRNSKGIQFEGICIPVYIKEVYSSKKNVKKIS